MHKGKKERDLSTIKWIESISKHEIFLLIVFTVCNSLISALSVYFAVLTRDIIDSAVYGDEYGILKYAIILVLNVIFQIALFFACRNLEERIKGRLEIAFKSSMFSEVLKKDFMKITSHHSGDILNRLTSDVVIISDGVVGIVPLIVAIAVRLVIAFIVLFKIDVYFAVIFLVGGVSVFFISHFFRRLIKRLHKQTQETDGVVRSFLQEALESLLVIKVFGAENQVERKSYELQKKNYDSKIHRTTISILANTSFKFVFLVGYVSALIWGAYRLHFDTAGVFTYGTLMAILQLVNQVQVPFAEMSGIIPRYYSVIASAERLLDICNYSDDECGEQFQCDELYSELDSLVIKNIRFKYDREIVLDNANLTVNKGDFAVIVGISGIGKSTLFKLLLGVLVPNDGRIYLKLNSGREIPANKSTRNMFSYVPQGNMLLSGTILENITFMSENKTDAEISKALEVSCAADFISALPEGLNTVIGEKGHGLSEGQVQRLAIARALLCDAHILLLDEATSALDEETELRLLKNIKAMSDKTCILISHKKAAMDYCDKIIEIENKKINVK